jgi:hypothetical protein
VNQAEDLHLGPNAVDEAVASYEQFAPGESELRNDSAFFGMLSERGGCLLDLVEQVASCAASIGFSDEVLERLEQVLASRQAPGY